MSLSDVALGAALARTVSLRVESTIGRFQPEVSSTTMEDSVPKRMVIHSPPLSLPLALLLLGTPVQAAAHDRPRVLVLTDIENEPDDAESMVRFLAYANHWDVEGLVATTSVHQRARVAPGGSGRSSRPTGRSATTS